MVASYTCSLRNEVQPQNTTSKKAANAANNMPLWLTLPNLLTSAAECGLQACYFPSGIFS